VLIKKEKVFNHSINFAKAFATIKRTKEEGSIKCFSVSEKNVLEKLFALFIFP